MGAVCRRAFKEAQQACAAAEEARRTAEGEAARLKAELGLAREQTVAGGMRQGATPGEPRLVQRIVARLEVGCYPCLEPPNMPNGEGIWTHLDPQRNRFD